jgi:hypothetical protein
MVGIKPPYGPTDPPLNYPSQPRLQSYLSHEIRLGDHRPVEARYIFDIPVSLADQKQVFANEMNARLDEIIKITTPSLHANPAVCQTQPETIIQLSNNSETIAEWRVEMAPDGVEISPRKGFLMPKQELPLIVKVEGIESTEWMIVIFVENGSPLLIEFRS